MIIAVMKLMNFTFIIFIHLLLVIECIIIIYTIYCILLLNILFMPYNCLFLCSLICLCDNYFYLIRLLIKEKAATWWNVCVNCSRCVILWPYLVKISGTESQKHFKTNNAFFFCGKWSILICACVHISLLITFLIW